MAFKDQISLATLENNMQGPSAAVGKGGPPFFPPSTTATLLLYQAAVVVKGGCLYRRLMGRELLRASVLVLEGRKPSGMKCGRLLTLTGWESIIY